MRSMWKGIVSFGLVSIPVRLYSATEEHDVPLHQVHVTDGGRIRYRRICEIEQVEVSYDQIARGFEMPDGETVVLTKDDLDSLPIPTSKTIEVLRFVPDEQVDSIYQNKTYYIGADGTGLKPYVLLRDALTEAGKTALVKVALRQRESLAILRPYGNALILQTILWPDEIRDASSIEPDSDVEVRQQELAMAASYIDTLSGDFEPEEFTDEYADALRSVVEDKVAGREVVAAAPAEEGGEVIDLMSALKASVENAKRARGEKEAAPKKTAAKKTPAKKTAEKPAKTTAKKTAKKTASRRTA